MSGRDSRILVVDDEPGVLESLEILLSSEGYKVDVANSGQEALEKLKSQDYHLIITDVRMEGLDGIEVLKGVKGKNINIPVIIISAYASPESALKAMKEGAYDYLPKPFKISELKRVVKEALGEKRKGKDLERSYGAQLHFKYLIGESPSMKSVYNLIQKASEITSNVLIVGESGTGKELVARAIHENSARKQRPFVVINCAGLPETLIESELFGYKKGAFTGAHTDKEGYFQVADGGTVFLDEIGELTPTIQVKLLRFLQEKTFTAIGCTQEQRVDVRIIAATNKDLEKEVMEKRFREDLYFRLNVIKIEIPPLRERKEDIRPLAEFFLRKYASQYNKEIVRISSYALEILEDYSFPGNVRELENIIERSVALESSRIVLPDSLVMGRRLKGIVGEEPIPQDLGYSIGEPGFNLDNILEQIEAEFVARAMEKAKGNKKKAAQYLGISMRSLRYRLEKMGVSSPEEE